MLNPKAQHRGHRGGTESTEEKTLGVRACAERSLESRHLPFLSALCAFSVLSVFPLWAFDPVVPGRALEFPRDRGAHLGHRLEWWYVTGQLEEINVSRY